MFGKVDLNFKKDQGALDDIKREIQALGMNDARKAMEEEATTKVSCFLHLQGSFYKEKEVTNGSNLMISTNILP